MARVAWDMAERQRRRGVDARIFGVCDPGDAGDALPDSDCPAFASRRTAPRFLYHAPGLLPSLKKHARDCDLIHHHGLWLYPGYAARIFSLRAGVGRLVSVHGGLSAWAVRHRAWKKTPAWLLYERKNLATATCLHATSEQELADIRRRGIRTPVAVIPLGIDIHPTAYAPPPSGGSSKTILFLSRLHRSKGLLDLVKSWAEVGPQFPDWRLAVAGPDANGFRRDLERRALKAGIAESTHFVGPVYGEDKLRLMSEARLFVLPSYSENFALVVLEALACGVPVITTTATPWQELQTRRCGWWIGTGPRHLSYALRNALSLPDRERTAMGARGRELAAGKYAWARVTDDMLELYQWIARGGKRPECVHM